MDVDISPYFTTTLFFKYVLGWKLVSKMAMVLLSKWLNPGIVARTCLAVSIAKVASTSMWCMNELMLCNTIKAFFAFIIPITRCTCLISIICSVFVVWTIFATMSGNIISCTTTGMMARTKNKTGPTTCVRCWGSSESPGSSPGSPFQCWSTLWPNWLINTPM